MSSEISYEPPAKNAIEHQSCTGNGPNTHISVSAAHTAHTHPAPLPSPNTSRNAPGTSPSPTRRTQPPSTRARGRSRRTAGTMSARGSRGRSMIHRVCQARSHSYYPRPRPRPRQHTDRQTTGSRGAKRYPWGHTRARSSRGRVRPGAGWCGGGESRGPMRGTSGESYLGLRLAPVLALGSPRGRTRLPARCCRPVRGSVDAR